MINPMRPAIIRGYRGKNPPDGEEEDGRMRPSSVVAPESTGVSTGENAHALLALLGAKERGLEALEERLVALAPHTQLAEPHVQTLHEIRQMMATLMAAVRGGRHPLAAGLVGASVGSLAVGGR
jgi:hypothetical protein